MTRATHKQRLDEKSQKLAEFDPQDFKLLPEQIDSIVSKLVPQIAKPEDREFFRGVLRLSLSRMFSTDAVVFVSEMLQQYGHTNNERESL